MRARLHCLLFALLALFMGDALAFTAIATIDGHALGAWYRASNYDVQRDADEAALEGCRVEARRNGLAHIARKCRVVTRARAPGYGADVCGSDGCNWAVSYESSQAAIDAAYQGCAARYTDCQDKDITYWEDFAGFAAPRAAKVAGGDCRPRTNPIRCQSSCTNGDCVVSYENGCKMRVRVAPASTGCRTSGSIRRRRAEWR